MPRRGSDSDDSYRSRSRKNKTKSRSRRSSSISSSSFDRNSSPEKLKVRKYKRSRSRSRDRSKRSHKSSRSKRRHRRSSSSSGSRSRGRKHSSKGKDKSRRSSSRSHSRTRSHKSSRRSRSRSRNRESTYKKDKEPEKKTAEVVDSIREKLEAALRAAADADAQLRQKGLLTDVPQKSLPLEVTLSQQLKRAQAIEEINSDSFVQQEFSSSRSYGSKSVQFQSTSTEDVITTDICNSDADDWKTNPEKLVHPSWLEDKDMRLHQWKKKLAEIRSKRYNGSTSIYDKL